MLTMNVHEGPGEPLKDMKRDEHSIYRHTVATRSRKSATNNDLTAPRFEQVEIAESIGQWPISWKRKDGFQHGFFSV
jgi:hypothetical protein